MIEKDEYRLDGYLAYPTSGLGRICVEASVVVLGLVLNVLVL